VSIGNPRSAVQAVSPGDVTKIKEGFASKVAKLWQVIGNLTVFLLPLFCCNSFTLRSLHPDGLEPPTL
jgi:hypothetical protein